MAENDNYSVIAGKRYVFTQASFSIYATDVANAELNQIGLVKIKTGSPVAEVLILGGNGGGGMSFPRPIDTTTGFTFTIQNNSGHDCAITFSVHGYMEDT